MTENSTSDKTKSTPTTKPSKALSTEAEAATDAAPEAPAAAPDLSAYVPGYIRKLRGLRTVAGAIEAARVEAKLPSLNPTDYRFVLGRPGGIPFSFPVQVVYKPESPQEHDLGTFRIGR